MKKVFVLLSSE